LPIFFILETRLHRAAKIRLIIFLEVLEKIAENSDDVPGIKQTNKMFMVLKKQQQHFKILKIQKNEIIRVISDIELELFENNFIQN
jgi:hypothetical protein